MLLTVGVVCPPVFRPDSVALALLDPSSAVAVSRDESAANLLLHDRLVILGLAYLARRVTQRYLEKC